MKFGLHNASFLPTTGKAKDVWPELRERAQWMEESGFEYLSVMDHLWQNRGVGAEDEPFMEGWMTLAAVASATEKLKLTTMVTSVGYRNPALVVKMVTTLDLISGGRAILGLGGGWFQAEYEGYGYNRVQEWPTPATRLRKLREAVKIAKALWQEPRATYEGRYFSINNAILEPKPLQKPRPRILIGGGGEQMTLRIVAEEADMCNFSGAGPQGFARKLDVLRRHCQEAGRDLAEIEVTTFERPILASTPERVEEKWRQSGSPVREGYRGLMGTPDQVVQQIQAFERAGVQTLFLMIPNDDSECRQLLAREVIPAFKE